LELHILIIINEEQKKEEKGSLETGQKRRLTVGVNGNATCKLSAKKAQTNVGCWRWFIESERSSLRESPLPCIFIVYFYSTFIFYC
jgi:hypothetical protein